MRLFAFAYIFFMVIGVIVFCYKVRGDKKYRKEIWRFTNVVGVGCIIFADDWFPHATEFVQGLFVGIGCGLILTGLFLTKKWKKEWKEEQIRENR